MSDRKKKRETKSQIEQDAEWFMKAYNAALATSTQNDHALRHLAAMQAMQMAGAR